MASEVSSISGINWACGGRNPWRSKHRRQQRQLGNRPLCAKGELNANSLFIHIYNEIVGAPRLYSRLFVSPLAPVAIFTLTRSFCSFNSLFVTEL